jgi:hypothetical protein
MMSDVDAAEELQVGDGVGVDGVVHLAADPERLPVGGNSDAVRRRSLERVPVLLLLRELRKLDASDLQALLEVHDEEPVEVRDLHEHPSGGSVGVGLEGDGPDAVLEVERPERLLGLLIDDGEVLSLDRAGDDVLSVGE